MMGETGTETFQANAYQQEGSKLRMAYTSVLWISHGLQ